MELIDRMKLIENYNQVEYLFQFKKEGEYIHFILQENNVYAPFTFEGRFTMKDFITNHIAFTSCDDLDELTSHLYKLYNNKKIKIFPAAKNKLYLFLTVKNISEETDSEPFELIIKMTEDKDIALFDLYNIQKDQLKLIQKLKTSVDDNLSRENPLYKEIYKILH